MKFYADGHKDGDFDQGIEMVLARVLASPKFIYRIEAEPATAKLNEPYRLSDLDLASRLSFFLWSTVPDDAADYARESGTAQGSRRPRAAGAPHAQGSARRGARRQLRGPVAEPARPAEFGPLPLVYPDFDDPLRQAMRREVELLFDSIVREDRSVVDLLNADYTFVNERLAKHYGIPNIYGSQFRRVTLGPDMEIRWGLTGKGAFLVTTSKPERTSPVTRGKWIMGEHPRDEPAGSAAERSGPAGPPGGRDRQRARADDAATMLDHRVRTDCIQCHAMMDPIGFSLENFDGIGLWRTLDANQPIDAASQVYDGTKIDGPAGLRRWLLGYSDQFVEVVAEKLLTYALGRGVEYQDMPLVRSISRDAARSDNRFSALVLGVVRSKPFQMNMKVQDAPVSTGGN